jgi:glycosyltransferase 2 family protein
MPPQGLKRALNWLGGALGVAGLVFVMLRLWESSAYPEIDRIGSQAWGGVAALIAAYAVSTLCLVMAWRDLLWLFGAQVTFRVAACLYGMSQLSRYIPGNVFHLASRQALGVGAGISAWALAKSAAAELALISVVGGLFAALALPLAWPPLASNVACLGFATLLVAAGVSAMRWKGPALARAFGWHALFLGASGAIFVGAMVLITAHPVAFAMLPTFCGAYVVAWLAGLLTPGAPAGLGIREFVLVFLLRGAAVEADLLGAVVLTRLVTVGGDVAFFLVAYVSSAPETER